ncbi:hypothetical protein ABFX02_04G030100 [Erythranthe guttata]
MANAAAVLLSLTLIISFLSAAESTPPLPPYANYTSLTATILSTLGFRDLAGGGAASFSAATPTTIFAPTDSSLLTCPTCCIPLLLQEHSVPGLYPLHFLRTLAFGTKIGTFAANRCLTVTTSSAAAAVTASKEVFVNGVEVTKPDLYNNGLLIVHGLQGFVSHLSPLSCTVESMTSLSVPQRPPPTAAFLTMHFMLKDAMTTLRTTGYSIVALAMRVKYSELSDLKTLTLFAIDDESIFLDGGGSHAYVAELGFHILPNRLLTAADLISLPRGTALPTMEPGRDLVVTSSGDGGPVAPTRINYVKVKRFDLVRNQRIVVHGLSTPFRHVDCHGF